MKDYKFKLIKEVDVIIPALSEEAAWVEIAKLNGDLMAENWVITLINGHAEVSSATSHEPFEDAMNDIDAFDDLSYLNPKGI